MREDFIAWINQELELRQWSQNELARQSGLSPQTVSVVMTNNAGPGPKFLRGIAKAFKMLEIEVWERAGMAPSTGPILPQVRDFNRRLLAIDERHRATAIRALDQQLRAIESVLGLIDSTQA